MSAARGPAGAGDRTDRPLHLQPRAAAAVLLGGLLGTPARYGLTLAFPPSHAASWPTGTFVANLAGAFLLGLLLESLARRGDSPAGRLLSLALGTGFLGAFTTYSALAVETDLLLRAHRPGLAALYAVTTVLAGLLLSTAGIAAGLFGRRTGPTGDGRRQAR